MKQVLTERGRGGQGKETSLSITDCQYAKYEIVRLKGAFVRAANAVRMLQFTSRDGAVQV